MFGLEYIMARLNCSHQGQALRAASPALTLAPAMMAISHKHAPLRAKTGGNNMKFIAAIIAAGFIGSQIADYLVAQATAEAAAKIAGIM